MAISREDYTGISRVLFSFFFMIGIMMFYCSSALGASAQVSVSVNGGAVNSSVSGSFATCTTCDANGENCVTNDSGSVSLYMGSGWLCSDSGHGGASCSAPTMDRGNLHGTHIFTGYASDCTGSASDSYTLVLDNTPEVQLSAPSGTISAPFDVTGSATFKPTLKTTKGTISLYINNGFYGSKTCTAESCSFSYQNDISSSHSLLDWNTGGPHTVKLIACGGGVCNTAQRNFSVDKTPTLQITNPADGSVITAPFDITGSATFKDTISSTKGTILLYINNGYYGRKTCTSLDCSFSYQNDISSSHSLLDLNTGGPYTIKLVATGGGTSVTKQSTVTVDKTPIVQITNPADGSIITAPFDVTASVTFKPALGTTKGTIYLYINNTYYGTKTCTTENCSFSYQNDISGSHNLLDLNTGGPYTIKLVATGGGTSVTKQSTINVDKTPIVKVISPIGNITSPFDITGSATFKDTLSTTKGTISLYINNTIYGTKYCSTLSCSFSYQNDISGSHSRLNWSVGGPHTIKLTANGGGTSAADQKTFSIVSSQSNNTGSCENGISRPFGSTANLNSGNLYHSQEVTQMTLSYNSIDSSKVPVGKGWTHTYNASISPQSNGALLLKQWDGNLIYFNLTDGVYLPEAKSGDTSQIIQNADGSYTRTTKNGITYNFNVSGNLLSIRDRNGNTITLTYSGSNLASITDQSGRTSNITTASGKIMAIEDHAGGVYSLSYSSDYLMSITNPLGGSWAYTYDAGGRMITKTDPAGYTIYYAYDSNGKLLSSTDPNGKIRTMTYNPSTTTSTLTEKDGGVWTYAYDPTILKVTKKTDSLGNVTQYTYDPNRNLLTQTDPGNSVTTYTYDSAGNITSIKDPLGNTTTYTYNSLNLVTGITDPMGNITQYTYDANGNMLTMTDPAGAVTQYQYDSKGNRISVTDPNNQATLYSYDANDNLTSIADPTEAIATFAYDVMGNMTSRTDPLGNVSQFTYDSLNRLVTATDPKGNLTTYTYDPKGNRTSMTDANGKVTRYTYTYDSQISNVTDASNSVTQLAYGNSSCSSCGSGADKLTSLTDAQGNITAYQYDLLGKVTQETDPAGHLTQYTYDSKGNLLIKTDANGNTSIYTYDLANKLTGKQYPDSSAAIYQYDQTGNLVYAGNPNMAYNLSYDPDRRITGITDSMNRTIQYTYDAMGNRATMTAPDGKVTYYTYDINNRLYQIITDTGTYSFTYDNANRKTEQTNPNGSTVDYAYDEDSQLTGITHKAPDGTVIESFDYQYDNVGNRMTNTDNQGTHAYQYDPTYQLTQALHPMMDAEGYTYDKTGNRKTETRGESTINYTTITGNRIQQKNGETFTYDGNGNIITRTDTSGTTTYTYDVENRLIRAVMSNSTIAQYKYDPFGRRIEKDVNGEATQYVYDGANVLYEYDGNNNVTIRYTQSLAIDDPLALQTSEQTYYYLKDALDTVTAITDANGNIVQSYTYDAYGNIHGQTDSISQPFTFTGREYDDETGLYFYRARMYDSKIGRFISKDPISFAGGDVNLFRMVLNNPINKIDPLGLYSEEVHFNRTFQWSVDAGIEPRIAFRFAAANQGVDEEILSNPLIPWNWLFGTSLHFQSRKYAEVGLAQSLDQENIRLFGAFLHILQDSFSHEGYGFPFGHAFDGTKPDQYCENSKRDTNMRTATIKWLQEFERRIGRRYHPILRNR